MSQSGEFVFGSVQFFDDEKNTVRLLYFAPPFPKLTNARLLLVWCFD
jgi:hypothetical protein